MWAVPKSGYINVLGRPLRKMTAVNITFWDKCQKRGPREDWQPLSKSKSGRIETLPQWWKMKCMGTFVDSLEVPRIRFIPHSCSLLKINI